jgi:hypothetical protein
MQAPATATIFSMERFRIAFSFRGFTALIIKQEKILLNRVFNHPNH